MDRVAGTMNAHAAYRLTMPRLATKSLAQLREDAVRYPSKIRMGKIKQDVSQLHLFSLKMENGRHCHNTIISI